MGIRAQPATFADLLQRYRRAAGLTQEELAERAHLSARGISNLERGVRRLPRRDTVRLLIEALSLPAEERAFLEGASRSLGEPAIVSLPADHDEHTAVAVPTNLPLALTSFVGRERELAAIWRLLGETRLLTLTGAGGCGKTRLALEAARELTRQPNPGSTYADGIWLVELAPLSSAAAALLAVASVLGVRERPGRPLLESLSAFLCSKQVLLILDNCEHLLDACAALAEGVLRVCPQLTILATSREALGIGGEQTLRVPSLRLPDSSVRPSTEQALACEAVRLFVQRAHVARSELTLTAQHVAMIEEICRRLDGIPLALELAAARLSALSIDQLSTRLHDRFHLLTGGSRTALPRQQTLRATLDWSYDLLSRPERLLFRRLSVFAGGWTLEAAEAICEDRDLLQEQTLDLLAGLVAKSIVLLDDANAGARYQLLETVRQYGHERLAAAGEAPRQMSRHLDWYAHLAELAAQGMGGAAREQWLERLEVELENLRTALLWSRLDEGRYEAGLRLVASLEDFWYQRGYASEGRRWLEDLLARASSASMALRARALEVLGLLTHYQGEESQALALFESAYILHSSAGNERGAAWALSHQGLAAIYLGDLECAKALLEQALPAHQAHGDRHGVAWILNYQAQIQQLQGHYTRSAALYEESLQVFRVLGDRFGISDQLGHLGNVARELGDFPEAKRLFQESLQVLRAIMDKPGFAKCFEGLAMTAAAEGQPERAARLMAAAHCLREAIGTPMEVVDRIACERTLADVHASLGEEAFAAAWAEGEATTLEEATAEALELEAGL